MSDILRRSLAPLTDEAWTAIDRQAARLLKGNLSGRRSVDVNGPHGWALGAVNLGRLSDLKPGDVKGVNAGLRQVLPLTEIRVPFSLNLWELDNLSRGTADPDLAALDDAARKAALFEEKALYEGFEPAGIKGILGAAQNTPITLSGTAERFAEEVESAILAIEHSGIGGPFNLVLGTSLFKMLSVGDERGYPLKKRIEGMTGGSVQWSPALDTGLLLSARGGDFEMTLGQDLSIGYQAHDTRTVSLYITESFTFRVLEPAAAVGFKMKAK